MSDLNRVGKLAQLLADQKDKVKQLEEQLKLAKAEALRTEREDLPDLMQECGLQSVTLEDGSKIEVREEVDAAITEATRSRAMAWLTDNDFGGLIKTVVSVEFERGLVSEARQLADNLNGEGLFANLKETVHPQTLRAFVREQMQDGRPIPVDLFNVHPYNIAKLTKGKK